MSLTLALLAPVAAAQGPAATPNAAEADALTDKARQLYEEGVKALAASKWAEAHASLLAAWRIKQHYQVAVNLGVAELKLGKHRDAAEHLAWYLREAPATKVEERKRAEGSLKEALAKVASLQVKVLADAGAEVQVDRVPVGRAPLDAPLFLEPGRHYIFARKEGHTPDGKWIDAAAGGSETVTLILEPFPEEPPARSSGSAGSPAPTTTATGATPVPVVPADDAVDRRKVILTAASATAGAALVIGIVFTVVANAKASGADNKAAELTAAGGSRACAGGERAADCDALRGLREDASTFTNVAGWSFVVAGAAGAGTLIYWLAAPQEEPAAGVRASPVVGDRGGGVLVTGAW